MVHKESRRWRLWQPHRWPEVSSWDPESHSAAIRMSHGSRVALLVDALWHGLLTYRQAGCQVECRLLCGGPGLELSACRLIVTSQQTRIT